MEKFLQSMIANINDSANIRWDIDRGGVSTLFVEPINAGPCPFSVAWSAHETVVGFALNSRIEFGPGDEDLPLIAKVIGACIDGRVALVNSGRRGGAAIELDDGSVVGDSGAVRRTNIERRFSYQPYQRTERN
ncbi:hypothetical protein [Micromonospora sp. NPDC005979]|uniref:hypothetical protein n=1 Tax=Micromonospora sp. NPDC005979 TaxID=3156726 RepID=UPI0033A2E47E